MTKNQLLLSLAKHAVNWGEGADFEFKELIHDSLDQEEMAALKKYYPEYFPEHDEDEEDDDYECPSYTEAFYEKVGGDVNTLLNALIERDGEEVAYAAAVGTVQGNIGDTRQTSCFPKLGLGVILSDEPVKVNPLPNPLPPLKPKTDLPKPK